MFIVLDTRSPCRTLVSRHRTRENADKACDKLRRAILRREPSAITHLLYCVREATPAEAREYPVQA